MAATEKSIISSVQCKCFVKITTIKFHISLDYLLVLNDFISLQRNKLQIRFMRKVTQYSHYPVDYFMLYLLSITEHSLILFHNSKILFLTKCCKQKQNTFFLIATKRAVLVSLC